MHNTVRTACCIISYIGKRRVRRASDWLVLVDGHIQADRKMEGEKHTHHNQQGTSIYCNTEEVIQIDTDYAGRALHDES